MSEAHEIQAEIRENLGKAASRRMRRLEDTIPAVIYGGGDDPQHLTLTHRKILKAIEDESFYSSILTVDVAGKKQKAVLKHIQRHAFKPKIVHMDFQRISAKEKLTMNIPLHFIGADEAPATKKSGIISHLENSVEVSCLPADLPEYIEVNVSQLDIDQSIHLSELSIPKGVEVIDLVHENDKAVASAHMPKVIEEPVEEEVEGEEVTAEGEMGETPAAEGEAEKKPAAEGGKDKKEENK